MPAKKIGKPLGGVGAERMKKRNYSLVLDDRLISKQFVTATVSYTHLPLPTTPYV